MNLADMRRRKVLTEAAHKLVYKHQNQLCVKFPVIGLSIGVCTFKRSSSEALKPKNKLS